MKKILWLVSGLAVYAAYYLINHGQTTKPKVAAPVDDLAHKLQDAWADHHTVA